MRGEHELPEAGSEGHALCGLTLPVSGAVSGRYIAPHRSPRPLDWLVRGCDDGGATQ